MSLINKMLKELDRRHADPAAAGDDSDVPGILQQLRPVKSARLGSEVFWWILAFMMLAMVSWLGWVMWQMTPKSIVTDRVLQAAARPVAAIVASGEPATPATVAAAAAPSTQPAQAVQPSAVQPTAPPTAQPPAPPAAQPVAQPVAQPMAPAAGPAAAPVAAARVDAFKLAPEIGTPIKERRARAPDVNSKESAKEARELAALVQRGGITPLPKPVPPAGRSAAAAEASPPASSGTPAAPPAAARPAAPSPEPRIERQSSGSPAGVAETLYRRAVGFINQGRVAEGIEGLRNALGSDARHEAARQTLVALLLEQKRPEEAAELLQQGLELNPANAGFAMLLSRIMVERQEVPGALALLQKHAAAATGQADYRAFTAALLQRVARHKEAADEYQAALQLSPQTGVWWVGLGISQEVLGNKKAALESFQRARATRTLSTDVAAYAEQRARLLQ